MSDIDIKFEWWELVLFSPVIGYPGLILGAIVGAFSWRKRPILGGVLGAVIGNFAWAFGVIYFK